MEIADKGDEKRNCGEREDRAKRGEERRGGRKGGMREGKLK